MTSADRDTLVDAYLSELNRAGIALQPETARDLLDERVGRFAAAVGIRFDEALAYYDVSVVRTWAREAASQLRDEQPGYPLLADVPVALAPVGLIARTIAALIPSDADSAVAAARWLIDYPTILIGGIAAVRCRADGQRRLAAALLAIDPDLSGRWSALTAGVQGIS